MLYGVKTMLKLKNAVAGGMLNSSIHFWFSILAQLLYRTLEKC
jgi:hypothetical protein